MAMARVSKMRLAVVMALVSAVATVGLTVSASSPAAADVTATSGRAFGVRADSVLGLAAIPPTPEVSGAGIGFGLQSEATLPIAVPGPAVCPVTTPQNVPFLNILLICASSASTQGIANPDPHLNAVVSNAQVAGAAIGSGPDPVLGLGAPLLTVGAVTATCRADGDVATGSATVAGLFAGAESLLMAGPIGANTIIDVPGVATVFLNEQTFFDGVQEFGSDPDAIGENTIVVNAVRIVLLDSTEIILGQVECSATGPDVNNVGDLEVIKVAPAGDQGVMFSFTVTCTGFGNAPATRTFTRTITGSNSVILPNIEAGVVCTVTETTLPGFDPQDPQTVTIIREQDDLTPPATFTNTRTVVPVPTGSVQVVKVAPADAAGAVFTFTISCPGVVGSPFTRTVTGSASSLAVTGIPEGTVCTAAETPLAGFVVQPNQTFPSVLAGATRQVTFTNTRVVDGPVGSVAVVKVAPADAQNLTFTFNINCQGANFVRSITGSGTSTPVTNIATGTVCTASEVPTAGFNDQPAQSFAPVATGLTQTVTFTNIRSGPGTGSVAVIKVAPADAQDIDFTFIIACPGAAGSPFERTVTGSGTSITVSNIPVGTVCTVSETPTAGFVDLLSQDTAAVVATTTQTVTFTNRRSDPTTGSVRVLKEAPADAQTVAFTFSIACPGVPGSPFLRSVTGSNATVPVSNIPVGTVCTASEARTAGFADQAARPLPAVVAGATQSVTFVNTRVLAGQQGPPGPRGPAGPQGPPGRILARTGAEAQGLVTLAGFALFLGSLLMLGGRSPGMLPALARNVTRSVRRRPASSSARSALRRGVKRRSGR